MKNLRAGLRSPFNFVVDYQRFVSSIVKSNSSPPSIRVSEDGSKISYKDLTLDVPTWISGLKTIYDEVKEDISQLCRGKDLGIHIPDIVPDDWTIDTRKYSWLDNGHFLETDRPLAKILFEDADLQLATVDLDGRFQCNMGAVNKVMQQIADINKKLSVLGFATPGQPVRASEFVDMKIRNSTRPRGYFRNNKETWFVTRRVKYENLIQKDGFFPIKLNPLFGKLLEVYLLGIRPLEEEFAWMLWGEQSYHLYNEYLWVNMGKITTEEQFSNTLERMTRLYCGVGLTVRPYRQLIIAVARTYLGSEFEIDEDDEDDLLAQQSNHSRQTRVRLYANEEGHLPCMSSDTLLRYGRVSEAWWRLVHFKPGALPVLPLKKRRHHHEYENSSAITSCDQNVSSASTPTGIAALDTNKIIDHLTATLSTSISQLKTELTAQIQQSVAKGIAEVLQRQSDMQATIRTHAVPLPLLPPSQPSSPSLPLPPSLSQYANSFNFESSNFNQNEQGDSF